jgi:hypothetical protein
MKKILLLILISCPLLLHAQKVDIDWIEVSGNKVIVHYILDDPNPNHQYLVNLFTSQDNYTAALTKVTGDVGTEVKPGRTKSIVWDVTNELPAFKGNLTFEIRGRVYIPFAKLSDSETAKVYKRGKNYPLNWTSGNLSGQVNIELYKGQDRILAENNVPNVGKYDWHIPGSTKKGADYRLKFTNSKDRNDVVYSKEFTIKPKVPFLIKVLGVAVVGGAIIAASGGDSGGPETPVEEPLPGNPGKPN